MTWRKLLFTLILIAAALPARAEETAKEPEASAAAEAASGAEEGHVFAPEGCDFAMTFPTEPYSSTRCDPDKPSDCKPQTTYTKVYGTDATVNFNITCNPVSPDMFSRYSEDAMNITLAAMAAKNRLDQYETGFQTFGDEAKQAVILGTGRTGNSEKLFVAQLWVGRKSLMTVEGEVVGPAHDEAEALFAQILASARHQSWKPEGKDSKKAGTDKKDKEDKEAKEEKEKKED